MYNLIYHIIIMDLYNLYTPKIWGYALSCFPNSILDIEAWLSD